MLFVVVLLKFKGVSPRIYLQLHYLSFKIDIFVIIIIKHTHRHTYRYIRIS